MRDVLFVKARHSIERLRPLFVDAELRVKELKLTNITLQHTDGNKGWKEATPFDRIITACQSDEVPDLLLEQLKEGVFSLARWEKLAVKNW